MRSASTSGSTKVASLPWILLASSLLLDLNCGPVSAVGREGIVKRKFNNNSNNSNVNTRHLRGGNNRGSKHTNNNQNSNNINNISNSNAANLSNHNPQNTKSNPMQKRGSQRRQTTTRSSSSSSSRKIQSVSTYPQTHPYFPSHDTQTCLDSRIPSNSYEEWMAWEGGYAEAHFFDSVKECCETWFPKGNKNDENGAADGGDAEGCVQNSNMANNEAGGAAVVKTISIEDAFASQETQETSSSSSSSTTTTYLEGMTQSLTPLQMAASLTTTATTEEEEEEEPPPPTNEIHKTDYQGPQSMTLNSSPTTNNDNNNNNNNEGEFLGAWQIAQQTGIQSPGATTLTSSNLEEDTFPTFSCGTGWTSASQCKTLCNTGLGCPPGESCYAGIPCPASLVASVMNANGNADEGMLGYIDGSLDGQGKSGGVSTNVCGSSYDDAERRCQGNGGADPSMGGGAGNSGGTLGFAGDFIECRDGASCPEPLSCYGGILCPPPPTISPAPTRSPVVNYQSGGSGYRILAYYAAWQWYDRQKLAQPRNLNYQMMTRINYAFFELDESGNIFGTDTWADPRILFGDVILTPPQGQTCSVEDSSADGCFCHWDAVDSKSCNFHDYKTSGLIHLAHENGVEIYPSLGGWTLSDAYPAMAASASARKKFAEGCVGLIKDYNFDGIDIDWEYPGYAEHSGTPEDGANFQLLLTDLRDALDKLGEEDGRYYGLTAALPCGPGNIANQDVSFAANILDELNLMTYDFHGAWDATTGVNAPLYDQAEGDPEPGWSVHGCVENWVGTNSNNPKGEKQRPKVNIGLPFYGRSYLDAKDLYSPHGGLDEINWKEDDGSPQYFNLMARMGEMTSVRDDVTKTQIAYFDNGMGMVTYDDERAICDKAEYALENGLGGFIIWEISGDIMDDLHTPLLEALNRKLALPNIDCEESFPPPVKVVQTPLEASAAMETNDAPVEIVEEPIERKDKTEVVGIPPVPAPVVMDVPVSAPLPAASNESPYTIDLSKLGSNPVASMSCEGGCPSGSTCVGNQASGQLITDEECKPCDSGQTWWPCDLRGLCWCWKDGTDRIAPAPESGLEVEVSDPHYTVCDDILTREMFDAIAPSARDPYSYTGLCDAILSYNSHHTEKAFGMGNTFQRAAELAAFLGNTLHESDEFKAGREYLMCADRKTVGGKVYCKPCDSGSFDWSTFTCARSLITGTAEFNEYCQPKSVPPEACNCGDGVGQTGELEGYVPASDLFFGRGAIQLSWNYNYIGASVALTGSPDTFCNDPDLVATVGEYAWGAGLYFWMEHNKEGTTSHMETLANGGDFGGTLNNINGGLECPAHGGWHEEAVKARLNRYCRAAKALGLPNLMHLGGCAGLEEKYNICIAEGTCSDCEDFVGTTHGDVVDSYKPPVLVAASPQVEQVVVDYENPCGEGLMQLDGHPDCCVPNTAYIGDGACDPYEPFNTEACGWDGGDCCKETCNEDSAFGCKAKSGGKFDEYGPFGFYCLDPTQPSALNPDYCTGVDRERIGDGQCNPGSKYNNPGCMYDGGDCCQETCDDQHSFYECGSGVNSYVCVDPRYKVITPVPLSKPTKKPTNAPTDAPTEPPTSAGTTNPPTRNTPMNYSTNTPTGEPSESSSKSGLSSSQFAGSPSAASNAFAGTNAASSQFINSPTVESQGSQETLICPNDVFKCEGGVYVSRDPANDCEFKPCPDSPTVACTSDVFKCDSGVFVSRDASNDCEFQLCPDAPEHLPSTVEIDDKPSIAASLSSLLTKRPTKKPTALDAITEGQCPQELFPCGSGVFVAKNPAMDCEYFPCPSNTSPQPDNPVSMASAVHSKYGDKTPHDSQVETQCSQELLQCPNHKYLFVGLNPYDDCNPFPCPSGEVAQPVDVVSMAAAMSETVTGSSTEEEQVMVEKEEEEEIIKKPSGPSMAAAVSETSGQTVIQEEDQDETKAPLTASSALHAKHDGKNSDCSQELKRCPDNSFVGRNPDDKCKWFACPRAEESIAAKVTESTSKKCTADLQKCSDGSLVGRDANNNCKFHACPSPNAGAQLEQMSSSVGSSSKAESEGMTHHEYSLLPNHDVSIRENRPTTNYNNEDDLKVDVDSGTYHSLIQFDILPLVTGEIQSAKLRIYATDSASTSGGMVEGTDDTMWEEASVTWGTAPKGDGFVADILGPVSAGHWYSLNVASLLRSAIDDGRSTITLRLSTSDNNRGAYASKEYMGGEFSPRLIIDILAPSTMTEQVSQETHIVTTEPPPVVSVPEVVSNLGSVTLFASDDTFVDEDEPGMNFARMRMLMVDRAPHQQDALIRWDVSSINFESVSTATMHIFVTDTAPGAKFTLTTGDWSEENITWDNAPDADGELLVDLQQLREGWVTVDAISFFKQSKQSFMSLRIVANSDNRLQFSSKEGDHGPKLIITIDESM